MPKKTKKVDKFKKKKWFTIIAPKLFNLKEIGQTFSNSPKELVGRTIKSNGFALTGEIRKQNIELTLRIEEVKNQQVKTSLANYRVSQVHLARIIRHGRTKIETMFEGKTSDGRNVCINVITLATNKSKASQRKLMRKKIKETLEKLVPKYNFDALVLAALSTNLQTNIKNAVKSIYPIRFVEIQKIELKKKKKPSA